MKIYNLLDYNSDYIYNDILTKIRYLKDNKKDMTLLDGINSILSQLQLDNQMDMLVKCIVYYFNLIISYFR